jgi:hypothetical protein
MLRRKAVSDDIFGEEHLIANRRGTMTDRQVRLIRWPLILRIVLQWFILGAIYCGAAYGILQLDMEIPQQTLYGIAGGASLPVIWLFWLSWRRLGSISRREVSSVAGILSREIRNTDKGKSVHEIVLEKRHFPVSIDAYAAFEDGATYRVYYQPKVRVLLTAERV